MTLDKCVNVKLRSLEDLARFASSLTTLGHGVYIIHFKRNNSNYYGIFTVFRDYYKYYGVPLFYYVETNDELDGNYLLVKVDEGGERVEVSKGTRPGWISIPIVSLEQAPEVVDVG